MLASHKLGTIHWYCTTCNVISVELLRLVFGLQDRIQETKREIKNMKRETSAKFSKIESAYEAVNEDLKILSRKIEGVKKCCEDSDKLIRTVQHETRNEIENIKKGVENKINKDDMEKALKQRTEMDSIQPGKARPVFIQFRDRILKNMVMESVSKLKHADEKYSRIIFSVRLSTPFSADTDTPIFCCQSNTIPIFLYASRADVAPRD